MQAKVEELIMASSNGITQIKSDEGIRPKGYLDSKNKLTIGIGFNLTRSDAKEMLILAGVKPSEVSKVMKVNGQALTDKQVDSLFQNSLQEAEKSVKDIYSNYGKMPQTVKDVLVNMSFQIGKEGLRDFDDMRVAVEKGDWKGMQKEMKSSLWAKQTSKRANRLIGQVGKVKPEPQQPTTNVGKAQSAKKLYDNQLRQERAQKLATVMNRQAQAAQLAEAMGKAQQAEEKTKQESKEVTP